jgi:hypothetical protein
MQVMWAPYLSVAHTNRQLVRTQLRRGGRLRELHEIGRAHVW